MSALEEVARAGVVSPLWRRGRFWLALAAVLLLGAAVVAFLRPGPGRDLDPNSPSKGGSKALARVLAGYGVPVRRTTSLSTATAAGPDATVLVVAPDDYSSTQLATLAGGAARLVVLDPSRAALAVLLPGAQAEDTTDGTTSPGCPDAGARAAGPVDLGGGTVTTYRAGGGVRCYDGALVRQGRTAVLGSSALLRNDALGRRGVAALDVNLLSADRTAREVVWLLPGADAHGPGAPTVWDLFPAGAHRAFGWLLLTGVVVVLWQARRMGPPVREPLPVVVRAAEVVEGHGRLYQRARARERAAAALRAGSVARLSRHLGLPRGGGATEVLAVLDGTQAIHARDLLTGPTPENDARLLDLAAGLRELEAAAGVPPDGKDER